MAAGYSSRVVEAISSFEDDGVVVCPEDYDKFAALIGDYFNESDDDDSRSEADVESGNVYMHSSIVYISLNVIAVTAHKVVTVDVEELGNFPV